MREALSRLSWTVACACLTVGAAGAAPLVTGKVSARNGTPLSGVQVQVEIRTVRTAGRTDDQGSFQFDVAGLFSTAELRDAAGLMLIFTKPGFESHQGVTPYHVAGLAVRKRVA